MPLVLALVIGTALAVAGRSRRVRAHLPRLTPQVRRLLALAETARPLIAKALRRIAANPRRMLPRELTALAPAVLPMPEPAVTRLEPVSTVDAFPEPEFAAAVPPFPPTPRVAEITASAPPAEELCEIALWRGYTKTRFYARLDVSAQAEDEGSGIAESPPFRFTGNGTLEQTEAAEDAHRALVEELVTRGWEPCESTGPWYAARFSRPVVALA